MGPYQVIFGNCDKHLAFLFAVHAARHGYGSPRYEVDIQNITESQTGFIGLIGKEMAVGHSIDPYIMEPLGHDSDEKIHR